MKRDACLPGGVLAGAAPLFAAEPGEGEPVVRVSGRVVDQLQQRR